MFVLPFAFGRVRFSPAAHREFEPARVRGRDTFFDLFFFAAAAGDRGGGASVDAFRAQCDTRFRGVAAIRTIVSFAPLMRRALRLRSNATFTVDFVQPAVRPAEAGDNSQTR
jgi:hypothetical protein